MKTANNSSWVKLNELSLLSFQTSRSQKVIKQYLINGSPSFAPINGVGVCPKTILSAFPNFRIWSTSAHIENCQTQSKNQHHLKPTHQPSIRIIASRRLGSSTHKKTQHTHGRASCEKNSPFSCHRHPRPPPRHSSPGRSPS